MSHSRCTADRDLPTNVALVKRCLWFVHTLFRLFWRVQHCRGCPSGDGQHQQHQTKSRGGATSHVDRRPRRGVRGHIALHKAGWENPNTAALWYTLWKQLIASRCFFRKTLTCIPGWSAGSPCAGALTACQHTIKSRAKQSRKWKKGLKVSELIQCFMNQ